MPVYYTVEIMVCLAPSLHKRACPVPLLMLHAVQATAAEAEAEPDGQLRGGTLLMGAEPGHDRLE